MSARSLLQVAIAASVLGACAPSEDPSELDMPEDLADGGGLDGGDPGDGASMPDARKPLGDAMRDDPISPLCGNAALDTGELCDDGNKAVGDGCNQYCEVEVGYQCRVPGERCALAVICGDGQVGPGEVCDDANTNGGDGCTADCRAAETGFNCAQPGSPCVSTVICGDKHVVGSEQCDDGNVVAGDGCGASCQLEPGYACRVVGVPCRAALCGDAMRIGSEECDDGNMTSGDGCDDHCRVESAYACSIDGAGKDTCKKTVCGDKKIEGSEQCDDGNDRPYDGCYQCQSEPNCTNSGCASACGDGIKFPSEECDDGNKRDTDGCSSACKLEKNAGFSCVDKSVGTQSLDLPVIYRDFRGADLLELKDKNIGPGHPDFENKNGAESGIVGALYTSMLGADKKPVYAKTSSSTTSGKDNFFKWYNDDVRFNRTVVDTLKLTKSGTSFVFDKDDFFPLDGKGFVAMGASVEPTRNNGHNFSFTSELRYWFSYQGGEKLSFRGDDDVWVYVNGRLAVDLGGVHGASDGEVTLAAKSTGKDDRFGITIGNIYEVVVFQAERHTTQSSYKLTLNGFDKVRTTCTSTCGDGIVTPDEVCDDGMNQGAYGGCMPGCQDFGPYCGDNTKNGEEQCDLGLNLGGHNGCTAECKLGPRCGDGNVDGNYGEMCDDAVNDGGYGECAAGCRLGERCGDGVVQSAEICDDGNNVAYDGCDNACYSTIVI